MRIKFLSKEFDDHRLVSFIHDEKAGLNGFIALHRVSKAIPAFGATRIESYKNESQVLDEVLRLSRLMSYKAALAGLKYGGGKAVLIAPKLGMSRDDLISAYADKINCLNGRFITGADAGVDMKDVMFLREQSPFVVGLKSDPVFFTTLGLEKSIEVCLEYVFGDKNFKNRSIAIQGVGKIGSSLLDRIHDKFDSILVSDIDQEKIQLTKKKFPKVIVVDPGVIYTQDVDVYCPCALGRSLNFETISKMKCKIIAGGANDQLKNPDVGELLDKLNILYAPDYVINAGGLISVVSEYENKDFDKESTIDKVMNIPKTLNKILKESKSSGKATNLVADAMAEKIFNNH